MKKNIYSVEILFKLKYTRLVTKTLDVCFIDKLMEHNKKQTFITIRSVSNLLSHKTT